MVNGFKTVVDEIAPDGLTRVKSLVRTQFRITASQPKLASVIAKTKAPLEKLPPWKATKEFVLKGIKFALGAFAFGKYLFLFETSSK